ncbi:MAG TPA: DUF6600 domain-containing protein [Verrucomicrobiae bacterium]
MKASFSNKYIFNAVMIAAALWFAPGALQNSCGQSSAPTDGTAPPDAAADMPADVDPNSPLAQVIRLAQSGVEESVILSYIGNSGNPFNLTPDQIIYLKDLGLPSDAVTAMIQRDQQLGVTTNPTAAPTATTTAPVETPEQPAAVTQNYFYDTLSPYGGWVNVEGYGLCWRPTAVVYDSNWQPYCDHGHWVYTDDGWFWLSDYSWGATAFHYGRWFHHAQYGWCWYPDTVWAPSWVTWRYGNDYCGWAPLPPHTSYRQGVGIVFNGQPAAAGFDFGLSVNFFTFVPTKNFCDPHLRRFRAPPAEVSRIYSHTTIINNFHDNSRDHAVVNNGIPPERISAVTHTQIRRVSLRESSTAGANREQLNRDTLTIHRPQIQENAVSTLNKGIKPPVIRRNPPRPSIINQNQNRPEEIPAQNNFSPRQNISPQNPQRESVTHSQNISRPEIRQTQPQATSPAHYAPAQTSGQNYDRRMSPKQQQLEEQAPHFNSGSRATPPASDRHDESHSEPARNVQPSSPQKPDRDQNGH